MKNNRLEYHKTNSMLNKKNSNLNFKQALSKRISKKSNITSKVDKDQPLKSNKKLKSNKSKEIIKNQIKPFLTKNEINSKQKKNTEKIKKLLNNVKNNISKNNTNCKSINQMKNKSTTNLCAPTPVTELKTNEKPTKNENESEKSSKLNDFITENNNNINKDYNNNINEDYNKNQNLLKTNLAFLIAKNQNYDDDSVFLNINESYLDYVNNMPQLEPKKRNNNNNMFKNKNELLSDDYSIKNNNPDNNDTSSLLNSIMNINKYLTNEVNHKAINNTNNIIEKKNKNSKPRKVYENQLSKISYMKELNKSKEELKNNENDINVNNIKNNNNINNDNNINNSNYQKELLNKVMKSKYNYTTNKSLKAKLMKKIKILNLEEINDDNNFINDISYFNTHSPKMSINNKIIRNFHFSPQIFNINKTSFNVNSSLKQNENNNNERIKVSKAKKYKTGNNNLIINPTNNITIENKNEKSTKSNKSNKSNKSLSRSKSNNNKTNNKSNDDKIDVNNNNQKLNDFKLINENANNLLINNINKNIDKNNLNNNNLNNNNLNNNIFDDEFFGRNGKSELNKNNNYINNLPNKKNHKKKYIHNSCNFICPSLNNYDKYNTLLIQERNNNINISCIEQTNNGYLYTQEDENYNNSKIQEIKIKLKNLNSPQINKNKHSIKFNIPKINELNNNNTINICKSQNNLFAKKNDKNLNKHNLEGNKNKSISNIIRNKNKSYIYTSKTPSSRQNINVNNSYENNEKNNLNISNDKITHNKIYIKQIFSSNSKYNTQNNFLILREKNKINGKNIEQLLKAESNKFNRNMKFNNKNDLNINMTPSINNFQTPDIQLKLKNKNIYYNSNNNIFDNKKILEYNNYNTTNNFYHTSNNNGITTNLSPKIYIKPAKLPLQKNKNNNSTKIIFFSPNEIPNPDNHSPNNDNSYLEQDDRTSIIKSYRDNKYTNDKKDNYLKDIEFKNIESIKHKLNKNINLFTIEKTKTKAYVKKNNNIKSTKNNNNKLTIKNKISNCNNRIIKYYNFCMNTKQFVKKPCYISKYIKIPKNRPICRRSFMTKKIYKYMKRVKNNICYIDKKVIKNKNNILENKEINNIEQETNIIKANILDFSLEQNKEIYDNNNINKKRNFIHNKDYQESVGEINLSFSAEEINTFKYRENTIEAVFNELNNINAINNDSEIKVTFGCQENINSNYEISTEGRIIKDSLFDYNNKNNFKNTSGKNYKRDEILNNQINKDKISSVIIYDNKEENEDIVLNIDLNKKIIDEIDENYSNKKDINDFLLLDINHNQENIYLEKEKYYYNNLIINSDQRNQKNKKEITSKDVIDFAQKLGNIFDKKKTNSIDNEIESFKVFPNKYYMSENKMSNLNNDDIIKEIVPKCKTYSPKMKKYLEILSHKDLTPLNKLELRMNIEKNDFNINSNSSKITLNELESENEQNVTFSKKTINEFQAIIPEETINQDNIFIENDIIYLLNIVSINNFNEIFNKLTNIIINENNINENNNIIKNIYIFLDIIIKKSISEFKFSFLYSIICKNIYCILYKKNEYYYNENSITNFIIISLDKGFEQNINNNLYSSECKENIIGIINFIIDLILVRMINIEKGFEYLNILYNVYINNLDNEIKNIILEIIIFLLNKLQNIIFLRKDINNNENLINFINDIKKSLENNNNSLIQKFVINENINEYQLNYYEEYNLNKYKNIKILNEDDCNNEEYNEEIYIKNNIDIEKKIEIVDYYYMNNNEYEIILIIKNDLINYTIDNEINNDLYEELISKYTINIYTIIKYYIEICIDYVDKIYLIKKCNKYINNIIENYSIKNKKNEDDNNEIIGLILNIDYIIMDNKNMYQIMGYLLYSLINYEIYKIEDLNKFIGKEIQTLINISKVIKYIIIYCNEDYAGDDYKTKILEEFKQTELFKNNPQLFDKYVLSEMLL